MKWTLATNERRPRNRRNDANRKLAKAASGTTGVRVWIVGDCHYCGDSGAGHGWFCTERCRMRAAEARKRAREHDVWITHVNRWAVFKQHDFTCHICHEPIDMTLPINLGESPTLDHVIPLLARGPHTEANLKPAHMNCNSMKGIEDVGTPY